VDDKQKIERIHSIIRNLGEKYSYDGKDFRIHHASKDLFDYVHKLGKSTEKYIPEEIKNTSERQLNLFFEEIMLGDGWNYKEGYKKYYTSSFRLCADVQEIALRLRWGTTVWTDNPREGNWMKVKAYQIGL
jgi:intein/homing endonuclease